MCNSQLLAGDAVILRADLERRGVLITATAGAIECEGSAAVIDRFAAQIVRLKPALLELLAPPVASLTAPRVPLELSPQAIARASRRLAKQHPDLWRGLSNAERHQFAVCVACHAVGIALSPEWEQWQPEGGTT